MSTADSVARLKITLEDVEPAVMRRLEIPLALRLDRPHLVIQTAMGWTDTHLYEFRVGDMEWGIPDADWGPSSGPLDARKTTLADVIEDTGKKTLEYLYDFGDGWEHTVKVERIGPADPDAAYPLLLEAEGRCPPEDIGGPPGYDEFLEAMADPDHERHDELLEWFGDEFDPHTVDLAHISLALVDLGKRRRRGTGKKAPRTSR